MSDDPKKREKKYAGASEGLSGAFAQGPGPGAGAAGLGAAGGVDGGDGVLVAEKISADEIKEVASSRKVS